MADRENTRNGGVGTSENAAPELRGSAGSEPVRTVDPATAARDVGAQASDSEPMQEPPSPCISVCALDENDVCMGCYRTAGEITDWFMATPAEKHAIVRAAEARRAADSPIRLL